MSEPSKKLTRNHTQHHRHVMKNMLNPSSGQNSASNFNRAFSDLFSEASKEIEFNEMEQDNTTPQASETSPLTLPPISINSFDVSGISNQMDAFSNTTIQAINNQINALFKENNIQVNEQQTKDKFQAMSRLNKGDAKGANEILNGI